MAFLLTDLYKYTIELTKIHETPAISLAVRGRKIVRRKDHQPRISVDHENVSSCVLQFRFHFSSHDIAEMCRRAQNGTKPRSHLWCSFTFL